MKRTIFFLTLLHILQIAYSQVETRFFPDGDGYNQVKYIQSHPRASKSREFPSFDFKKLIDEDNMNLELDVPFRFGKGFDADITLSDGEWTNIEGGRLWTMEFRSVGAYSINFVFDKFYMPDGTELYIINADGTMLYGPVSARQNTKSGYFLTDLIQGELATIYLFEPTDKIGLTQLTIRKVVHGYKNLFSTMAYSNLGESDTCNNDINCFPVWNKESNAVALVLLSNGEEWCSGSLLMTADQNFEPYFLSAFHCIDIGDPEINLDVDEGDGILEAYEINNAENWMFKFQYKMRSCGGNTATTGITYNGAEFRSAWNITDFALMEMDITPLGDIRFTWLGWDRSGSIPTFGTGIHHPSGDVMKISFEEDQFQVSSWGGINNHWLVYYEDGVVEHGSSGSPILDQNGRITGQLHGNQNYNPSFGYCVQPRAEYGCFHLSWDGGGTDATRLRNWLDPCGTGAITTTTEQSPSVSGPSVICSSGATFEVSNLPGGVSASWSASPSYYFTTTSGTGSAFLTAWTGGFRKGVGTITATLVTSCDTFNLTKSVWAGTPASPAAITLLPDDGVCRGPAYYFQVGLLHPYPSYVSSWYWDLQSPGVIIGSRTGSSLKFYYPSGTTPGRYSVAVKAVNPCGDSSYHIEYFDVIDCDRMEMVSFNIYPNPVRDVLNVEITANDAVEINPEAITELRIYDTFLSLKKQLTFSGSTVSVNTGDLPHGVYLMQFVTAEDFLRLTDSNDATKLEALKQRVFWSKFEKIP